VLRNVDTIQLPRDVFGQLDLWCAVGCWLRTRRLPRTLLLVRTLARPRLAELEWCDLGLLRILCLLLARATDEMKLWVLGSLRLDVVAFAVLPSTASLARDAVSPIVEVIAVLAAYCAVEVPVAFQFSEPFELLLVTLLFVLKVATRHALGIGI
jgi:hypothetical protein